VAACRLNAHWVALIIKLLAAQAGMEGADLAG